MQNAKVLNALEPGDWQALAQQLACPDGEIGVAVSQRMYQGNANMIQDAIEVLDCKVRDRVLELGHGNGKHVSRLIERIHGIRYFGMELSQTMYKEAKRINLSYVNKGHALFRVYDGVNVPYVHNFFHKIVTVNTLYFWEYPIDFLKEMYRVLRPGGTCVVAFVDRSSMKDLPFVAQSKKFVTYDSYDFLTLVGQTEFTLNHLYHKQEKVPSNTGDWVERAYFLAVLAKPTKKKGPE
jgi:SAM-dependent methyltransferase